MENTVLHLPLSCSLGINHLAHRIFIYTHIIYMYVYNLLQSVFFYLQLGKFSTLTHILKYKFVITGYILQEIFNIKFTEQRNLSFVKVLNFRNN